MANTWCWPCWPNVANKDINGNVTGGLGTPCWRKLKTRKVLKTPERNVKMIAERLRYTRDPHFKNHEWHAGHLTDLGPINPRISYETQQRRKRAGRVAWQTIRKWEKYWKRPKLTSSERFMLLVFFRDELFASSSR